MEIFNELPCDWRDLQNKVKIYFEEMGYHAEVGKIVESVRGKNEIDVYIESTNDKDLKLVIFVECKYWESNIPQREINAFRTVINDSGANIGYFISKSGFQSGAFESAEFTSLNLLTYNQLIDRYADTWGKSILVKIAEKISILDKYESLIERSGVVPGHIIGFNTEEQRSAVVNLIDKIGFLFYHISILDSKEKDIEKIFERIINSTPHIIQIKESVVSINTLRDYINLVLYSSYIDKICEEIDELLSRYGITVIRMC